MGDPFSDLFRWIIQRAAKAQYQKLFQDGVTFLHKRHLFRLNEILRVFQLYTVSRTSQRSLDYSQFQFGASRVGLSPPR